MSGGDGEFAIKIEVSPGSTPNDFADTILEVASNLQNDSQSGMIFNQNSIVSQVLILGKSASQLASRAGKMNREGFASNPFQGVGGNTIAFHSFNKSALTYYSAFKLRLPFFPCLFEAFCVAQSMALRDFPHAFPYHNQTSTKWRNFVLQCWNRADDELKELSLQGSCYAFFDHINLNYSQAMFPVRSESGETKFAQIHWHWIVLHDYSCE